MRFSVLSAALCGLAMVPGVISQGSPAPIPPMLPPTELPALPPGAPTPGPAPPPTEVPAPPPGAPTEVPALPPTELPATDFRTQTSTTTLTTFIFSSRSSTSSDSGGGANPAPAAETGAGGSPTGPLSSAGPPSSAGPLSSGEKVNAIVGGIVGGVLGLALIGGWIFLRRPKRNAAKPTVYYESVPSVMPAAPVQTSDPQQQGLYVDPPPELQQGLYVDPPAELQQGLWRGSS